MTLTIIFGTILAIGIGLCIWQHMECGISDWKLFTGITAIIVAGIALIVNLITWLPSEKNSEIKYYQLQSEKKTIEAMLKTDKDVDRLLLNSTVICYNNKIIEAKANSHRIIFRDYYSQHLDWEGLDLIEWR